jgi:amino-acid N-acetyltransferase
MEVLQATEEKRDEIISLLESQKLPTKDLPHALNDFTIALEGNELVGVIGMERYCHYGLLRSMVVHPGYRNRHIAETLVKMLEEKAASSGITSMFLLTETGASYFLRKGYNELTREEVPADIKASTEFSYLCPVSATVMKKELIAQATQLS